MCVSILFLTLASGSHPHHKNPPFSPCYPHLSPVKHLSVQVPVSILSEYTSLSLSVSLCAFARLVSVRPLCTIRDCCNWERHALSSWKQIKWENMHNQ
jgi:hypothetical protein